MTNKTKHEIKFFIAGQFQRNNLLEEIVIDYYPLSQKPFENWTIMSNEGEKKISINEENRWELQNLFAREIHYVACIRDGIGEIGGFDMDSDLKPSLLKDVDKGVLATALIDKLVEYWPMQYKKSRFRGVLYDNIIVTLRWSNADDIEIDIKRIR